MPSVIEIDSLNDPRVSAYAGLTNAQLRSRRDERGGIIICESARVIRCAVSRGCEPLSLLMERRHLEGQGAELMALCGDIPVYTGDSPLLEGLTGFRLTRGLLGAFRRPLPRAPEEVTEGAGLIAVLEGITDAANVGAVFRSAAALGVDAVLLDPTCCDPFSRRAMRVSMGTVLQVPWARLCDSPEEWRQNGPARLKALGFTTAALALDDRSVSLTDPALKRAERLAFILGTEGEGLLPQTIAACDYTVRIPMAHGVDSLNVAAAGAVAFWELRRERL